MGCGCLMRRGGGKLKEGYSLHWAGVSTGGL